MEGEQDWNALLESEGLGLIEPEQRYQGVGGARVKPSGKWSRLEAELNGITAPHEWICSWGCAHETALGEASNVLDEPEAGPKGWGNSWESLQLELTATALEAKIADRRRGSVSGLDAEQRVVRLGVRRKPGQSREQWQREKHLRIMGEPCPDTGPAVSEWISPVAPHATRDAGNGPLSIKDPIVAPREIEGGRDDGDVGTFPLKVVDTHTYLPGRSPFQMSRIASSNSDITG